VKRFTTLVIALCATVIALGAMDASAQTKLTFGDAMSRALVVNKTVGQARQDIAFATAQ
jgi:hypothetical protein